MIDQSRNFDTKKEAIDHALNTTDLMATSSVDSENEYLYNGFTGQIRYSLEMNEEGKYYWEIY